MKLGRAAMEVASSETASIKYGRNFVIEMSLLLDPTRGFTFEVGKDVRLTVLSCFCFLRFEPWPNRASDGDAERT